MSEPLLSIRGLAKSFGGVRAIEAVSLDVPAGSLTALIGPNGAGKTTVFNLVTNLFPPDAGSIRFGEVALAGLAPHEIARLGLLRTFQTARVFPGLTALENVLAGAHRRVRAHALQQMLWLGAARREERALVEQAAALLDLVGLQRFRDVAATSLPMGAQKLIELCRALMARPRLLLLDEPAAGLNDSETAELATLIRAMRESGITVMLVEHNMGLVMGIADEVVVLDLGRIIARGTPHEVQRDERVIAAYLGTAGESAA
jgi:branched-chain amino acid transport system ATP-binding protein